MFSHEPSSSSCVHSSTDGEAVGEALDGVGVGLEDCGVGGGEGALIGEAVGRAVGSRVAHTPHRLGHMAAFASTLHHASHLAGSRARLAGDALM